MKLDSRSAKHKLAITALLLALFAIPFAWQTQDLRRLDSKQLMAGGTVVANTAQNHPVASVPATNDAAQATIAAGSSFTGALAH